MGRVSKKAIHPDLQKELNEQLAFLISSLTSKEEIDLFLDEFLTKEEKIMLGKRVMLYMMMYKGLTDTQIHNALSVSYETLRMYRNIYENKSMLFRKYMDTLIKKEKTQLFFKKIEKILEPFSLALKAKTSMKARSRLASGDFWRDE